MDRARTLPPLVRGKVTGVLNFFVDNITLFRNILLLTDNFDLVLQVQWWGEHLSTHIRPKKLQLQGKSHKNSHLLEAYNHSVKYEVKTTLDLFKSYLKTCERVELCVLEVVKNYIIGSAFLTDIISLLNNNKGAIKLPIIDYLGEAIGEVSINLTYSAKPQQKYELKQCLNTISDKDNHLNKKFNKENSELSNKIKSNCFTLGEKTLFYNIKSKENLQKQESFTELDTPLDWYNFRRKESITDSSINQSSCPVITVNIKSIVEGKELSGKCLPEINTLNDSSKVLHFDPVSCQVRPKDGSKSENTKNINKFNSNSIKYKSKQKNAEKSYSISTAKKSSSSKNFSTTTKNEKKFDIEGSSFDRFTEPELADHQSIPLEESSNSKVLNYLLGSDMSKNDEEIALNDFKKLSPSHNLVDSISQLCLVSDKNTQRLRNNWYSESPTSSKPKHLIFDLNNSTEKNYYEKFFLKSNCDTDFEVAEFLNQPENRVLLGKSKCNKTESDENEYLCNRIDKSLNFEKVREENVKRSYSANEIDLSKKANSCVRCKYFKKLDELDTIIESLKHFEKKIQRHDTELQLDFIKYPDALLKSKK